jgi:hypothetical protein
MVGIVWATSLDGNMKPKLFIGSSSEQLELAYAAQEGLERDVEVTVWTQSIFELSKTAMASLIDALDENDFGLFILAPDDITAMRDASRQTVRDNVIFELGLFIGRMGSDRCFMIVPRGVDDLHLPSDLLGLTPATFDPDRQDKNLVAALGPACNRIRKAISKLGAINSQVLGPASVAEIRAAVLYSDPDDCIILIESWMGRRTSSQNRSAIRYEDVDRELSLVPGSAYLYIEQAAQRWRYVVGRKGKDMILFEEAEVPF